MASLQKMVYLIACVTIANGMPRNSYINVVTQTKANHGRIFNTASRSQFNIFTSYGTLANLDINDLQYALSAIVTNMLRDFWRNFPEININHRNVFGPNFPDVGMAGNPNYERTPKYFPTTKRFYRPTHPYPTAASNRPTARPIPSCKTTVAVAPSTKPTVAWTPIPPFKGGEVPDSKPTPQTTTEIGEDEDDYDDIRPIVLKDPSTLKNEVSNPSSRPPPNVEHGSVQAGS